MMNYDVKIHFCSVLLMLETSGELHFVALNPQKKKAKKKRKDMVKI